MFRHINKCIIEYYKRKIHIITKNTYYDENDEYILLHL